MAAFLLLVISLSISSSLLLAAPRPANAQFAVARILGDVLDTLGEVWDKIKEVAIPAASTAVINGVTYFLNQMAYQAAVALTSDCPGQTICWNSKSFADGFKGAWQGAIGEAVGTLGKEGGLEKLGINICDPKFDINFKLKLSLGLMDEVKPPPPKCEFNNLVSNWSAAYNSLKPGALLDKVGFQFEKGQSPISASLVAEQSINVKSTEKGEDFKAKETLSASAGGGFTGVYDPVSGRMKSPPVAVKGEFERSDKEAKSSGVEANMQATSGSIASNRVLGVVLSVAGTFANTLLTRLWNKAVKGLLSTQELVSSQPDFAIDVMTREEAMIQSPGATGAAKIMQSRFATPVPREVGVIDPLSDFSMCPTAGRNMNNCVMDMQFALAVRSGDVEPLSVQQAIDKGMLHGDWKLVSTDNKQKNQDPNCYADSYCESNLKKLRAMRVIPVGWEIAAHKSSPGSEDTLNTIISQFDQSGAKYYHMIDPDWILKAPPVTCKSQVIGPQLIDPQTPNRAEYCADRPSCLKQDDRGVCVGGWGYCTRERNAWRFNADTCPPQYNSCRALTNKETEEQVNYLINTLDFGICASDNVGCKVYSLQPNGDPKAAAGNTWMTSPERYLNKQAEKCDAGDDGCTSLVILGEGQSLNLIRNSGFEELEDLNGDNEKMHAKNWFPAAESNGAPSVPTASAWGGVAAEPGFASDGLRAMRLDTRSVASSSRISQDMIRIRPEKTYHLEMTFTTSLADVRAKTVLEFRDGGDKVVQVASLDSYTSGDLVPTGDANVGCVVESGKLVLRTVQTGKKRIQDGCTFMVRNADIRHATLYIAGASGNAAETLYVDAVQLEEGKGSAYHSGYGGASSVLYAKVPPAYLGCRGEDSDAAECSKYSAPCRENEVGCSLYTPTNGDAAIPAVLAPLDSCPAECVGYDVFKQEASDFDQEKFPVYFIPTTAAACGAAEVGCSEFTDVSTEQVMYFTSLRRCQNASEPDSITYYTWEGSETTGYELKVWSLKSTAGTVSKQPISILASDVCANSDCADSGYAPCTALKSDGSCDDNPTADPNVGKCSAYTIAVGDFDCREFYDKDGNRHYRYLSKTILATNDCRELRITQSTESDCARTGGFWSPTRLACSYRASPPDSEMCASSHNGCRAYKGNAAGNIETVFSDDFEKPPTAWSGTDNVDKAQSTESVVVGGHSLKVFKEKTVSKDLSTVIGAGKSYTLSFWARGSGNLTVRFLPTTASPAGRKVPVSFAAPYDLRCGNASSVVTSSTCANNSNCAAGNVCEIAGTCSNNVATICTRDAHCGTGNRCEKWPQITLTSTWKRYELGPIFVASPIWTTAAISLSFNPVTVGAVSAADAFIDNVSVKQVQDNIYVVRDSWVTPQSCDQKADGTPSPLEMLGCRAYKDVNNQEIDLRNFSQLCRQKAVGCAAYSATQNTPANPYEESFNAVCRLDDACPNSLTATACPCDYKINDRSTGGVHTLKDVCRVRQGEIQCRFKYDGWDVSAPDGRCSNNLNDSCSADSDCGPIYPVNWGAGQPDNWFDNVSGANENEDCGEIRSADGTWNDLSCHSTMWASVGICDDLSLTTGSKNWLDAQAQCVSRGSRLVVIDSMDKNNLVKLKCASVPADHCWIGLSDTVNEGQYVWVNGVMLGIVENKCITDSRCSNDPTRACTIDDDCGAGNQCMAAAPDRVRVEADERMYLAIQKENKCKPEALACKKMAVPHTNYEMSCANTNDTCNTGTGKCNGNASKSCVVDSQCGQQATCELGIHCVTSGADNRCSGGPNNGQICNSDTDCLAVGAGCKCTDPITRNFCTVTQGSSTCVMALGSGVIDRWDPKAVKDDPAKYSQTLCSTQAVGCNQYISSDGTLYFKEPGSKICEYKENVTVNGQQVFGWFRKSDSGAVVPCAPGYSKNNVNNQIPKNGDFSCTLPSVCTRSRGCSCPNDTTPICSVPLGNMGCGYQGWVGACDVKYDRCEEFLDPQDMSRTNPAGTPYYYIDNEKLDKVTCAGSVSLKQGCVLFNQTSKVNKFWAGYATYQSEKVFGKSNQRVSPVDCSKPNRDATCAKRCYTVEKGTCDNAAPCSTDADCSSVPGTHQCNGEWRYGGACATDADCGKKYCDVSGKDCTSTTCPVGERCIGWKCDTKKTDLLNANDSNIIIKVKRDRECAKWYQCMNSAPTFNETTQKWMTLCTNFGLCTQAAMNGQTLTCQNWERESPTNGWLSTEVYQRRDVSYAGLDYSGYSVAGSFSGQLIRSVNDNGTMRLAVVTGQGCTSSGECTAITTPGTTGSSAGYCAKAPGQSDGTCAYNVVGGRSLVGTTDTSQDWKTVLTCRAYPAVDSPYGRFINTDYQYYMKAPHLTTPTPSGSDLVTNGKRRPEYKAANICNPADSSSVPIQSTLENPCDCVYDRFEYGKSGTYVLFRPPGGNAPAAVCSGGRNEGKDCTTYARDKNTPDVCDVMNGGICAEQTSLVKAVGLQGACLEYDESTAVNGSNSENNRFACLQWLPIDQVSGAPDPYNQHREAGFSLISNGGGNNQLLYCTSTNNPSPAEIALHTDPSQFNKWCCWDDSCDDSKCDCAANKQGNPNNWFFGDDDLEDRNASYRARGIRKTMLKDIEINMAWFKRDGDHNGDNFCTAYSRFFLRPDDGFARMFYYDNIQDNCGTVNDMGGDWNGSRSDAPTPDRVHEVSMNQPDPWGQCAISNSGQNGHENWQSGCVLVEALWEDDGDPRGPLLVGFHFRTQINSQKNEDDGWWQWNERKGDCGASEDHHNGHPVSEIGNIGPDGRAGVIAHLREQCIELAFAGDLTTEKTPVARTNTLMRTDVNVTATGKGSVTVASNETMTSPVSLNLSPFGQAISEPAPDIAGYGAVHFKSDLPPYNGGEAPAMVWATKFNGLTDNAVMGGYNGNYSDTVGGIHTASGAIFTLDNIYRYLFVRTFGTYRWNGSTYTKINEGTDNRWSTTYTAYANRPQVRAATWSASVSCKSEGLCKESTSEALSVNGSTSAPANIPTGGLFLAQITYYAFADKDHMPLTRMIFDPGNGTGILTTPAMFKNQRGTKTDGVTNWCGSAPDWGLTSESCTSRYFVQSVTYQCSTDDVNALPACDGTPSSKYPCADKANGRCKFKPRVQFLDNWDICTGTCNGTFCRDSSPSGDCKGLQGSDNRAVSGSSGKKPWIDFPDEITVAP